MRPEEAGSELVALDDVLKALAAVDFRKSQVVELRFFWGIECGRDGRGAEGISGHGSERLAVDKVVAAREKGHAGKGLDEEGSS